MATVNANLAMDMYSPYIWYGVVIQATKSIITISDGSTFGNYQGSFTYANGGLKGGTVNSYTQYYNGILDYNVTGVKANALTVANYVQSGNASGLDQFVLSGNDTINGSAYIDGLVGYKGNDVIYGNGGADVIWGDVGNDVIYGGLDNDIMDGGDGKDTLIGGSGYDVFIFGNKPSSTNIDTVNDFSSKVDKLMLIGSVFTSLVGDTDLRDNIVVGSNALDYNDYLIFNPSKGTLSYDADGSGKGKAIDIVKLIGVNAIDTYYDISVNSNY